MKKILKLVIIFAALYGTAYGLTAKKTAENIFTCNLSQKPMEKYQDGQSEAMIVTNFRNCITADFNFYNSFFVPYNEIVLRFPESEE